MAAQLFIDKIGEYLFGKGVDALLETEPAQAAIQGLKDFGSQLIPSAAASTLPAPVEERVANPPQTAAEAFQLPPEPAYNPRGSSALPENRSTEILPGLTKPIYLEGTTTLPTSALAPSGEVDQVASQGINQDMAGFAASNPFSPNPNKPTLDLSVDDFGIDPEAVAKFGIGDKQVNEGLQSTKAILHGMELQDAIENKQKQGLDTTEEESMLERIGGGLKDFFGNEERMLGMALAFTSLQNPAVVNQGYVSSLKDRLNAAVERRQSAQLLPYIEKNYPQYAELARSGAMTAKEIMTLATKNPSKLSQYMELLKTPEGRATLAKLKELGALGGQTINVDTKGASKYNEKFAESMVKFQEEVRGRAAIASDLMDNINRFADAASRMQTTGNWEQTKKNLREMAASFGFDVNEADLAAAQSVDAAAALMVATELRKNKGPQTDFDAEFTKSFVPSLKNLPETNRQIQRYMRSTSRLDLIKGAFMDKNITGDDYASDNKVMKSVRLMRSQIPAVMPAEKAGGAKGEYFMFETFYQNYTSKKPAASEKEILRDWMRVAGKPVPEYLK